MIKNDVLQRIINELEKNSEFKFNIFDNSSFILTEQKKDINLNSFGIKKISLSSFNNFYNINKLDKNSYFDDKYGNIPAGRSVKTHHFLCKFNEKNWKLKK